MGTTLAVVGLVGGIVALVFVELLVSGDKSTLYRAVMVGVAIISAIALVISLFFSGGGVNMTGTIVAILGLIAVGVFYTYGSSERVAPTPPTSSEDQE